MMPLLLDSLKHASTMVESVALGHKYLIEMFEQSLYYNSFFTFMTQNLFADGFHMSKTIEPKHLLVEFSENHQFCTDFCTFMKYDKKNFHNISLILGLKLLLCERLMCTDQRKMAGSLCRK